MTDPSKQDNATDSTKSDDAASVEAETALIESAETAGGPSSDTSEPNEGSSAPPKPPSSRKPGSSSMGGWFTALLVLLLLAGLIALAYYGWQREQALQVRMDQLDEALNGQSSQLSGIQRQAQSAVAEAEAKVEQSQQQNSRMQKELQSRLEEQAQRLEGQLQTLHQQLRSLSATSADDWKLAEAYYLTRLASQRLLMERDTGSALALLEAADEIVKNYPDSDLYSVRRALADDMTALRLANNVDLEGIYLRIAALGQQAQALPVSERLTFRPENAQGENADEAPVEQEAPGIWTRIRQSFHKALGGLQSYIRISRDDDNLESLVMGPAAAEQLLSSLQLSLDTAQLALLREQPEIYRHSLDRAIDMAARLYTDSQQRSRFIAELQALRDMDILQELPGISASQQAFTAYMERRHRLAPAGNGQQQELRGSQP